jgi:quinol monooxygenase YgiN
MVRRPLARLPSGYGREQALRADQREITRPKSRPWEDYHVTNSIRLSLSLAFAAALFALAPGQHAFAQSAGLYVNAVDIDVAPGQIDSYLAALKENGAEAVKEPGCREFNIHVQASNPNHVFIYEVYDNAAALEAHRQTPHFKKYAATTASMVAKRDVHPLTSVAFNAKAH